MDEYGPFMFMNKPTAKTWFIGLTIVFSILSFLFVLDNI